MEETKVYKNVKEVFKDYNSNSFELNAAKVIGINLYKRKQELELIIESDKMIDIKDILAMEKYMENRFQVKDARITIKYSIPNGEERTLLMVLSSFSRYTDFSFPPTHATSSGNF